MESLSRLFHQPEYIHVAINHFPLVGLIVATIVLAVGLIGRSRPLLWVGLLLVGLMALSAWPVSEYGEAGYDRVLSMSDDDGQAYLKYHAHLADRWVFLYYLTAGAAAVGGGLSLKWPRAFLPTCIVALVLALASLTAGMAIAHAGGGIRHREFRSGPAPPVPAERDGRD